MLKTKILKTNKYTHHINYLSRLGENGLNIRILNDV